MNAKTTTIAGIAAIAATGALAFGAGVASSDNGDRTGARHAQSSAVTMRGGPSAGMGHRGQGQGPGAGMRHGRGMGQGAGAGSGQRTTLTAAQRAKLLYMREEEKLAHDVYTQLAQRYPDAPFTQIAGSEQRHASAVQRQLDRAGIPDPTAGNAVGTFENADLQKLYDTLVTRGSASRSEALKVGALIEETDIADLRASGAITTDAQLKRVYAHLERASGQHLRIFVAELKATGVTYAPTVLSQASYATVLASSMH
jgi:hypothetical protein